MTKIKKEDKKMTDITPIISVCIMLLSALLTAIIIPWIKKKTTAEQQAQLAMWVRIFVSAAEQLFTGGGRGEEKLAYVADMLRDRGYTIDANDTTDELRAMIEAAVGQINI